MEEEIKLKMFLIFLDNFPYKYSEQTPNNDPTFK